MNQWEENLFSIFNVSTSSFTDFYWHLSIPIPIRIYSLIDLYSSFAQGLGWGSGTIKQEINACLSLLRTKPNIFIDIGANKGLYTADILNKMGPIETHIFEPSELN